MATIMLAFYLNMALNTIPYAPLPSSMRNYYLTQSLQFFCSLRVCFDQKLSSSSGFKFDKAKYIIDTILYLVFARYFHYLVKFINYQNIHNNAAIAFITSG